MLKILIYICNILNDKEKRGHPFTFASIPLYYRDNLRYTLKNIVRKYFHFLFSSYTFWYISIAIFVRIDNRKYCSEIMVATVEIHCLRRIVILPSLIFNKQCQDLRTFNMISFSRM